MNTETIETTIRNVEHLYQQVTGHDVPAGDGAHAPIPPEADAIEYVEEQLHKLLALLSGTPMPPAPQWAPPIVVSEDRSELVLAFDLAGVARDDVEVTIGDGVLVVQGTRPAPRGERIHVSEYPLGRFYRALPLPVGATADAIHARLCDGLLEVRIANATADRSPQRIAID